MIGQSYEKLLSESHIEDCHVQIVYFYMAFVNKFVNASENFDF